MAPGHQDHPRPSLTDPPTFLDTIEAEIVPTDLYSIIQEAKETQFAQYGKHCQDDYERNMQALRSGRPQMRLERDRVAREIVRLLLATGSPTHFHGSNNEGYGGGIEFLQVRDIALRTRVNSLMNEDGLLDFMFQCHAPNYYAFQSEFIIQPASEPGFMQSHFEPNPKLRKALTEMLEPFSAEKPLYVLPEKRR